MLCNKVELNQLARWRATTLTGAQIATCHSGGDVISAITGFHSSLYWDKDDTPVKQTKLGLSCMLTAVRHTAVVYIFVARLFLEKRNLSSAVANGKRNYGPVALQRGLPLSEKLCLFCLLVDQIYIQLYTAKHEKLSTCEHIWAGVGRSKSLLCLPFSSIS